MTTGLTITQIYTEIEKQVGWMNNEPMQKQWITISTNRCDVYKQQNTFSFMGYSKLLPEQLSIEFSMTNDHIERDDCKWKVVVFNFENLGLN